jgi:chromosomal replication initiator protein
VAYSSLNKITIDQSLVEHVLKDINSQKDKGNVSVDVIKKFTAEYYNIKIEDLTAKTRAQPIAGARQIAMYLTREITSISFPKIGEEFGGRDHTTVLHAYEKIKGDVKSNSEVSEAIRSITNSVKKYTA